MAESPNQSEKAKFEVAPPATLMPQAGFAEGSAAFQGAPPLQSKASTIPSSPSPAQESLSQTKAEEKVKALVMHFEKLKIHPVLIFGTSDSGKTMMLLSLLSYARDNQNAHLEIRLGKPVFPSGHYDDWEERHQNALRLYNDSFVSFSDRKRAEPTQLRNPFFLPVDISVQTEEGVQTHRFAFLEAMGEWYERKKDEKGVKTYMYQELQSEIAGILRQYTRSISVIFVAPTDVRGDDKDRRYSHECLANSMTAYEDARQERKAVDNLLLLLSKWDAQFGPDDPSGNFSKATPKVVLDTISGWFLVWPTFKSLTGLRRDAKSLTPYSAAWVNASGEIMDSGRYRRTFERFNRTLWNWLYGNVTSQPSDGTEFRERTIIYPDVAPPKPRQTGRYAAFTYAVLRLSQPNNITVEGQDTRTRATNSRSNND